jgi:NitT/TauT family transport system permease protein
MGSTLRKLAFYAAFLILWQLVCQTGLWPPYSLPPPAEVAKTLWRGFADGTFPLGIYISMRRILIGFGISFLAGTSLGFAIGRFKFLEETIGSMVLGLQTLPSVCWLPLSLLWFGLNERAILFVTVMGAVLSITISTHLGVKQIPPIYIRAGKNLGAKGLRLLLHVIIPSALPSMLIGVRQGWSFAWRSLMAGELLFVSLGLGHLLMMGRELNDMSQVLAVMTILICIGLIFDRFVFGKLEAGVAEKWGLKR